MSWRRETSAQEAALLHSEAFPTAVRSTALQVLLDLPAAENRLDHFFNVRASDEVLTIPYRIYNPDVRTARSEPPVAGIIRSCYYSRHHDGFVRQRCLRHLLTRTEPWVVPFVVQLIGEYVIEIVEDIHNGLDLRPGGEIAARYGRFIADNPAFLDLTAQRATSYWNEYHRFRYPALRPAPGSRFEIYPGFRLIDSLRHAALEAT